MVRCSTAELCGSCAIIYGAEQNKHFHTNGQITKEILDTKLNKTKIHSNVTILYTNGSECTRDAIQRALKEIKGRCTESSILNVLENTKLSTLHLGSIHLV